MRFALALVVSLVLASTGARAQAPRPGPGAPPKPAAQKVHPAKEIDMRGLTLGGVVRTPELLYFVERAHEELERAQLERRSFIPRLLRTVDEEAL